MKKLFTLFAAIVMAMAMNATKVTFDFSSASDYGYSNPAAGAFTQVNNGDVLTKDGVTITVGFTSGNGVRFFANTNTGVINLREYVGSTLTISAPAGSTINAINLDGSNLTSTYLSGDITSKEWTGDASSVTMNIIKSTVQINSMVVTLDESQSTTTVDTITVSQAKARIDAGNLGKCYVYGRIVTIDASKISQYSNLNCWFVDLVNPLDTLEGYKMNGANNAAYTNENEVEYIVGDTVLFYASALKKFNTTYEINEGYYVETLGGTPRAEQVKVDFATANVVVSVADNISFNLTGANASLVIDGWETSYAYNNKAMAGTYDISALNAFELTVNGAEVTLVSGSLSVEFVDINADGSQNQYKFKLNATSADGKLYYSDNTIWPTVVDHSGNNRPMINDNTSIDVQMALQICEQTGTTATTTLYNVYGYVASIKTAYDQGYKNSSFYMTDVQGGTTGTFLVYRGKSDAPLNVGDKIVVKQTNLINYEGNTPETNNLPKCEVVTDFPILRHGVVPVYDTIQASVAEALEVGNALAQHETTEDFYEITAYVISAYDPDGNGEQTWYMADNAEETNKNNEIMIQFTKADQTIVAGQQVTVIGKILHYYKAATETASAKEYICIRNAYAHVIPPTAIENVEAAAKAIKVVKNGQLIIEKNGVKFNVLGAKL